MVLFRHIPLAGTDHAVDVHLKGYRLFRPIQCLNQYARDFKYEHCGSLWIQGDHLSIQQATCKRASPYLSQLDSLDSCHARKTESAWDNSNLKNTDPPPQVLWCLGLQRPGSGQSLSMLGTWIPGCGPCQPSHLTLCFMTCISTIPTLPRSTVSLCPSGSAYEPISPTRHQGTQSHSRTQTQLRVLMRSCPSCRKLAIHSHLHTRDRFSGCLQLLLAMPSTSESTVAWPGRVSSHSFPRSMWTTWTSCTTPCHRMRLSTPHCAPSTCLGRGRGDYAEHHWL